MSFTTNGNMHRHARIHEKNGTAPPKTPPGRKLSESKTPSKKDNFSYSPEKVLSSYYETEDVNFSKTQHQRPGHFYQPCYRKFCLSQRCSKLHYILLQINLQYSISYWPNAPYFFIQINPNILYLIF